MSDELPRGWAAAQPARAKENSPRIYPWVTRCVDDESRQGRKKAIRARIKSVFRLPDLPSPRFFRPSGAWGNFETVYPAMNRWAIFGRPCETTTSGGAQP